MPNGLGLRGPGEAPAVLGAANRRRNKDGARRQVAAAEWALGVLGDDATEWQVTVGRLRIDHPGDTLAELAVKAGMSKDTYAGLRRLGTTARRKLSGQRLYQRHKPPRAVVR